MSILDKQFNNKEFDAIVVGSGPGGATVARELSKRKKKALILERGGDAPPRGKKDFEIRHALGLLIKFI